MKEQMNTALAQLQDALTEINDWAELIKKSERSTAGAIEQAALSIQETQKLIGQLQADALSTQKALRDSTSTIQTSIGQQLDKYQELAVATSTLVDYLKSVNFPARLDKMDTSVAAINTGVGNLSDKMDRIRDQLNAKLDSNQQQLEQTIKAFQQQQEQQFKAVQQKLTTYFGIIFAILVLLLGLSIFLITK